MATLNLRDIKREEKKKLTWENIVSSGYISQSKADLAIHKAKRKIIVGSKECGKTIIGLTEAVIGFETDGFYNPFGFRKHLTGAAKGMGKYTARVANELKALGFDIKREYKLTQSELYRLTSKSDMLKNQVMNFGSLDDYSGTTDGRAPSIGYVGTVIVDEAVIESDALNPDKIPSQSEWYKLETVITSNLNRYNQSFSNIFNRQANTTFWYFMNNWGPHPLILETDDVFPEEDFIEWVLGYPLEELLLNEELITELFENEDWLQNQLYKNHTAYRYKEDNDTLYARMTVFANPLFLMDEKKAKQKTNQIRTALLEDNREGLTILLGMRQKPKLDDEWRVYPEQIIRNIKQYTIKDLEEQGYKIKSVSYGVDIDVSRVNTITPAILFEKKVYGLNNSYELHEKILLDEQYELKCVGSGVMGSNLDLYTKEMAIAIRKHIKENKLWNTKIAVAVDDNRQWFTRDLYKSQELSGIIDIWEPAQKNGIFDIYHRQDTFITGLTNDIIYIHPGNQALIMDLMVTKKRAIDDGRRDTNGTTNYLDRIDSMEYSLQQLTSTIWRHIKGGRR